MQADVKGDVYEGILSRSAAESPKGAGQYFTPRELITGIVDVMRPGPEETVCDPACGTGGFLVSAHEHVLREHGSDLDPDQARHLKTGFARGFELVPMTGRLCAMNLYLHGMDADPSPVSSGTDSLAQDPGERFGMVLTNPPFGKKSSVSFVTEEGGLEREDVAYERQDFWTTTKNKQLNFLQHVFTLLEVGGCCAIVVPDNVLFEGGAGETVRRRLLRQCDVHTLLRLPTGIFYAQGVKANVLFFDKMPGREEPWTRELWVYDLRTNSHFTLKKNPLRRVMCNELDQQVCQMTQRSAEGVVDPLGAGVGCDLGRQACKQTSQSFRPVAFQAEEVLELADNPFDDLALPAAHRRSFFGHARREPFFGVATTSAPYSSSQRLSHSTPVKPLSAR